MSDRIHDLLNRNLREVLGECDAARERPLRDRTLQRQGKSGVVA
jgi:hypothetical protein